MRHALAIFLLGAALTAPCLAEPGAPTSDAKPAYRIAGFRHAHFGMTQAEVRAAITVDFGSAAVTSSSNAAEGTTALQAKVADLPPGPGAATISYIFGATSKRLAHVNVVWETAEGATPAQRDAVALAAVQLAGYFQSLPIRPRARADVTAIDKNSLLMFAAVDDSGAAVELVATGISFKTDAGSNTADLTHVPVGAAMLRVSYAMNAANPDVRRIARGSF